MHLVLTELFDAHTTYIIAALRARGADVVRFNPAEYSTRAEISLRYTSTGAISTHLRADGRIIDLDQVRSVWWWRPQPRSYFEQQSSSLAQDAWSFVDCAWLPARPRVVQRAQLKALQLGIASQLGFELAPALTSRRLELRITVVGERAFAAEIRSLGSRATVYRQHALADELRQQCVRLVRYLGLRYAAIDMVLKPDGRYGLVGLDPHGQFLWIERATGMPIAEALADELLTPASPARVPLTLGGPGLAGAAA